MAEDNIRELSQKVSEMAEQASLRFTSLDQFIAKVQKVMDSAMAAANDWRLLEVVGEYDFARFQFILTAQFVIQNGPNDPSLGRWIVNEEQVDEIMDDLSRYHPGIKKLLNALGIPHQTIKYEPAPMIITTTTPYITYGTNTYTTYTNSFSNVTITPPVSSWEPGDGSPLPEEVQQAIESIKRAS